MRPSLYLAITSHGFGHAVRMASIVAEIQRLNPDILPIMATTVPHWLLDSYLTEGYIQRHRAFDVGVIQSDSLTMDKASTLAKWQEFIENKTVSSLLRWISSKVTELV
jgi:spore coat polysaccharide biosynthesis predicted glycosyltransferase SpsG